MEGKKVSKTIQIAGKTPQKALAKLQRRLAGQPMTEGEGIPAGPSGEEENLTPQQKADQYYRQVRDHFIALCADYQRVGEDLKLMSPLLHPLFQRADESEGALDERQH